MLNLIQYFFLPETIRSCRALHPLRRSLDSDDFAREVGCVAYVILNSLSGSIARTPTACSLHIPPKISR